MADLGVPHPDLPGQGNRRLTGSRLGPHGCLVTSRCHSVWTITSKAVAADLTWRARCAGEGPLSFSGGISFPWIIYHYKLNWVKRLPYLIPDFHVTNHILVFVHGLHLAFRGVSWGLIFIYHTRPVTLPVWGVGTGYVCLYPCSHTHQDD